MSLIKLDCSDILFKCPQKIGIKFLYRKVEQI